MKMYLYIIYSGFRKYSDLHCCRFNFTLDILPINLHLTHNDIVKMFLEKKKKISHSYKFSEIAVICILFTLIILVF